VIPGFHDLGQRFTQFEQSLKGEYYERMSKALSLIDDLKKRERYKHFYEIMTESPEDFPLRVMHHDAKIANVLFNKKNGRVICPIDLDTVMPGYFFSDLGDMIRSMACINDENSKGLEAIIIRKDYYEAIVNGYLAILGKQLTPSEKKYIHYAGLIMVYMQALRFLTDYLNGDSYYRTIYPEQNFDRAMNQYVLLSRLEEWLLPDSPSYR
jgi:Ser/Thr protein kinase RdoA (MazF antagonist)